MLVTALVGPFFVDWTVYRSTFEKYAERVLGHRVTVLGDADLSLLPTPAVIFTDVRVGEAEDPLLVVSRFQMRIELPPLLKGEVRVLDMTLERPHLNLSLDENGRLDWLTSVTSDGMLADLPAEDVAFERVSIVDGAVSIVDARSGETHRIDAGNLLVSARTLAGPFKVDGSATYQGEPYSLRLATGRRQVDGSLRLKGQVTPSTWRANLSVDGQLFHDNAVPKYEGSFQLASIQDDDKSEQVWQASGDFAADISRVTVPSFKFRYGPEDRVIGLDGKAELVYSGEKRFDVAARAKQIDLDRIFGGGPQQPISVGEAGPKLVAALKAIPVPEMKGTVALDLPAVVVGGGLAQDVRLDLETALSGWRIARLAGRAPGRTVIASEGNLGLLPDLSYRGSLSINSEQPGVFVAWWSQAGKGPSTIQPVSLEGRLSLVPEGAALDNLRLNLAGAEATGGLSYRKPHTGNAVFSLSLDADKLDIDQIETLARLFQRPKSEPEGLDVSVRLLAREVSVRGLDGKGLSLEAEYSENRLRIDRLFAEDLAGAELDVSGRVDDFMTAPEGHLAGTLNATDLTGVVALLESVLPDSGLLERLKRASAHLVPARFQAELKAAARDGVSEADFKLTGDAGGTTTELDMRFNGRVDAWRAADVNIGLDLTGPNGGQLLRQLGFEVLPIDELKTGELHLTAAGKPQDGLEVALTALAGGATLGVDGHVKFQADATPNYQFAVTAAAPDLSPFALLFGKVLPVMAGAIDADIIFNVSGRGSKIDVTDLQGTVAGVSLDGGVSGDLAPIAGETNRRFKGNLAVGTIDLRFLSEAILGPDQWFSAGDGSSIWPNGAFGAPMLTGTDLTLQLKAERMIVDDDNAVRGVTAELRLTPTMLRLDNLSGTYANGKAEGALAIRRSGAEGSVSGNVKLTGASVRDVVWQRDGRPVAAGTFELLLEFEGAGRSISGMVAGLTGGGTFTIADGELRGINPQAFSLVIRAVDAGLDLRDDKIREVFLSHMEAGSLGFKRMDGTVTLIGGRLSARNVVVDSARADIFGSAEINLNSWTLDGDFSLTVDPGENAVTGAEPQVGMLFKGPVEAPLRSVDIAPFTAFLTLRAFEQEVERVEKLQAEILERDRLLRELKRQQQERDRTRREAEDAAARTAEEAARAKEAARRATEAPPSAENVKPAAPQNQNRLVPPAIPPKKSTKAATAEPASFAERIRAMIGKPEDGTDGPLVLQPNVPAGQGAQEEANGLPPLAPPRVIEDLLVREMGIPNGALDGGPDPVINGGVAQ